MSKNKKKTSDQGIVAMPLLNPNAAGIDVGDTFHAVAVPTGRDDQSVKKFGAFTCDLKEIVKWLKQCRIETVAMESTGVYWKNLFSILSQEGFDVVLAHAGRTRNVTGRKADESDAQWIQRLHSCGLLAGSFQPDSLTESLRSVVRFRRGLTQDSSRYILRMEKALECMNIKFHTVISDIMGKTGKAVVEAILAGEREPKMFLPLIDGRIKATTEEILKSLEGNWREEHLYLLGASYKMYKSIQSQIIDSETKIEQMLKRFMAAANDGIIEEIPINQTDRKQKNTQKKKTKNQPFFNTREYLYKVHKVDVIEIYGLSEITALEILSETGTDLSKWPKVEQFISWLNLCPNNKITGGKLISSHLLKKKPGPACQAFRIAANSIQKSNTWLGDYFRRMKSKGGNKYAIVATARKIAIIYYNMVRYKQDFAPINNEEYQEKYRKAKIAQLEKRLERLKKVA
jgi:transposase